MLAWAITFLIIALISGILGFTGIMAAAAEIAKIIFIVFLILFFVSIIIDLFKRVENSSGNSLKGGRVMLGGVVTFFAIAIIAGIFGFTGIMAASAGIAKILFFVFLTLFIISFVIGIFKK